MPGQAPCPLPACSQKPRNHPGYVLFLFLPHIQFIKFCLFLKILQTHVYPLQLHPQYVRGPHAFRVSPVPGLLLRALAPWTVPGLSHLMYTGALPFQAGCLHPYPHALSTPPAQCSLILYISVQTSFLKVSCPSPPKLDQASSYTFSMAVFIVTLTSVFNCICVLVWLLPVFAMRLELKGLRFGHRCTFSTQEIPAVSDTYSILTK